MTTAKHPPRKFFNRIVPSNVYRLDGKKVKGWQVRWYGGYSKYFADGGYGSPFKSLSAAILHLKSIPLRELNVNDDLQPRIVERIQTNRKCKQYYVEISNPYKGKSPIRAYIGTENTYTENRERAAVHVAKTRRNELVAQYKAEMTAKLIKERNQLLSRI